MNSNETFNVNNIFNLPKNEENILNLWRNNNVLQQIKDKRTDSSEWNFLDGPPFVNGNPHHGHLLVSTIKDSLARYHSNNGLKVSYQIGFDCHGLPMEQAAEKEMGRKISSDANIEEIANFNNICQNIQDRCSDRFEVVLSRLGRQFESDKTYYTSNIDYMNSLWISFKQLFDKGLIYRGKKVMPYSYGCMSALSNFEANQNYMSTSHTSLYVKFKLKNNTVSDLDEYFLVWTTTPWSLLANQALCLNPDLEYVCVESRNNLFWINKDLYPKIFKNKEKIVTTKTGKNLKDIKYIPLFNYFNQSEFKTLNDNYVTNSSGTGIVHIAPLFGADDFRVCMENEIINKKASDLPNFLNDEVNIKIDMFLEGNNIKGNNIMECSDMVIEYLKKTENYFKKESIVHNYPFCWRTDTPLIYLAQDCWFLNVQKIKERMIENNSKIYWYPETIGINRFNNWIKSAPDWCLSRNRFWGTPIPIWKSINSDDYICIESKEELEKYYSNSITNMHREYIDNILIQKDGKTYKRIESVFDCWYESGLAGIAKEGKNCRNASYPVDFIAESLDQTRGWFYTLNVLSTALFDKPAFKKVIVSGLILASDGMKMSKRLNNYTPPEDIMKDYGSDVLRMYLLSSPATQAQEFKFVDKDLQTITRKLLPYFHAHKMLVECITNLKVYNFNILPYLVDYKSDDKLDIWIENLTYQLKSSIDEYVNNLELFRIPEHVMKFIDNLTNVWVKFSRDRLKFNCEEKDMINSVVTMYNTLIRTNKIISPFMPFNSDLLYNVIIKCLDESHSYESIHVDNISKFVNVSSSFDQKINKKSMIFQNDKPKGSMRPKGLNPEGVIDSMENVISIIENIRSARINMNKPLTMPIRNMQVYLPEAYIDKIDRYFDGYILEQGNVEMVTYYYTNDNCSIEPDKGSIGKMFKKEGKHVITLIKKNSDNIRDILSGNLKYNFNGEDIIIDKKYFKIITNKIEKDNYYTYMADDFMILLEETLDEDLIWKTKLNLWRRDIQNTRKESNYNFWDKLKLIVDSNSVDPTKFAKWKENFQEMINSEILFDSNLTNTHQFNFEDEIIKYSLIKE